VHVSKDVSYRDDNIILSFIYQVLDVNHGGMFWTITNDRHQIVDENVFNNYQNIVLTLGIVTLVANIVVKGFMMKKNPLQFFMTQSFLSQL
jgi:hypothetical protein